MVPGAGKGGLCGMDLSMLFEYAWVLCVLVGLEGILAADNAVVMAVMVKHLPHAQQKSALLRASGRICIPVHCPVSHFVSCKHMADSGCRGRLLVFYYDPPFCKKAPGKWPKTCRSRIEAGFFLDDRF